METPRPSEEEAITRDPVAEESTSSVDDLPSRIISVVTSGPFAVGFQGYENSRKIRKAPQDQTQG